MFLRRIAVALLVPLALVSCTTDTDPTATTPVASAPTTTASLSGVTVEGPASAFVGGAAPEMVEQPVPADAAALLVGPVVQIGSPDLQPLEPVVLRFPPPPDGVRASIAYLDEQSGWWLPVETAVDPVTGELTAVVDHFSWWSEIRDRVIEVASGAPVGVQQGASWLEYQGGRLLGNRATRPTCDGSRPGWVASELIVVEDDNAELFACGERDGDDYAVELVNNRGYPVTVEFSDPFDEVQVDLPAGLAELVEQIGNPDRGSPTRVFLPGQGGARVTFSRPSGAGGVIEGHARRDGGTILTDVVFDLASVAGADLPVGGGRTLGSATLECYASTVDATAEAADTGDDAGHLAQAAGGLRGCLDGVVDTETGRAAPGSAAAGKWQSAKRLLRSVALFDFEQRALDVFVNDATAEADLVDVSFRWRGEVPEPPALGAVAQEWYRHSTSFTIRADGSGEILERTYTPCGTSPDCSYAADLAVVPGADAGAAVITYTRVRFLDADGREMTPTATEHAELAPYFPAAGQQADVVVDDAGRLVVSYRGAYAAASSRSPDGNTYCSTSTTNKEPCGA